MPAPKKSPIVLLQSIIRLVPKDLERKLFELNTKIMFYSPLGWSEEAIKNGIIIDLSQVRWVDIGAVVHLVLFIESAKRASIEVLIYLPYPEITLRQKEHLKKIKSVDTVEYQRKKQLFISFANRRLKALNYLKVIGFESAAICSHIKTGKVSLTVENKQLESNVEDSFLPDSVKQTSFEIESEIIDETKFNYEYKLLVPLTWLRASDRYADTEVFEELFERVISDTKKGLDKIDALTIKNVLIYELLKNVREHANTEYGLIAVALQQTKILMKVDKDGVVHFKYFYEVESNYLNWIYSSNENYIDIYFGDSGSGIINKLHDAYVLNHSQEPQNEHNIIEWAFDKWSTSKMDEELRRGTKGLYRINRIVNKYDGLVTIRTNNLIGGFQKGGYENAKWIGNDLLPEQLMYCPGTLIRIHFSPMREIAKLTLLDKKGYQKFKKKYTWESSYYKISPNIPSDISALTKLVPNTFFNSRTNLLLIVELGKETFENKESLNNALFEHLKFLSLIRHPNGIVLYGLPGTWDEIEVLVDSVNQQINYDKSFNKIDPESINPDHEQVYDPILILGENSQAAWLGANYSVITVLNELYNTKDRIKSLPELKSYNKLLLQEQTRIHQFFSNDDSIVSLSNSNEIIYNFHDLISHFQEQLNSAVDEEKQIEKHLSSSLIVTPNLKIVENWIDLNKILKGDLVGYALALYVIFSKEIENINQKVKIVLDNNETKDLANEFCKLAGFDKNRIVNLVDEIDGRLPRRNRIFEKGEEVLIFTSIISSSETVHRSIKAVQRDLALPTIVLCLINQCKDDKIKSWGKEVKIISMIQNCTTDYTQENIPKSINNLLFVNPNTFNLESKIESSNEIDEELLLHIGSTNSLHFNHLGKANGRHFTFYLNPKKMIDDSEKANSIIYIKFIETIKQWIDIHLINEFCIWRPSLDFKASNPLKLISSKIYDHFKSLDIKRIEQFEIDRRALYGEWVLSQETNNTGLLSENLIIIDWGSMTGTTIQQMLNLAVARKKKRILVCILFSQFSENEKNFFNNIIQLKVSRKNELNGLFSEEVEDSASVKIEFIYSFPLKYYESYNCPVCEHIKALNEFGIQGQYMSNFSEDRKTRLKIKDKSFADFSIPPQDFYSNYENDLSELNSTLILKMFRFRTLLNESLSSTKKRFEVQQFINSIKENIEIEKVNPTSNLYACLYFLSIEIMWLQKPPLIFQVLRKVISELALEISSYNSNLFEKVFQNSNSQYNNKLVVRFKFAAISVLRSSDKLLFCKNIFKIFLSSKHNNYYSHNLTQNLFYHIHSLLNKKYHTSSIYFKTIENQLDEVLGMKDIDIYQQYVIQYLRNLSRKRRYALQLEGKSDLDLIKSLKKELKDYYGVTDHSHIFEAFRHMNAAKVQEPITRLDVTSPLYELMINQIKEWITDVNSKWGQISGYIESVVNNHLYLLKSLYESNLFKRSKINEYFINESEKFSLVGYDDEFTGLIKKISENPSQIQLYYEQYILIYNKFKSGIFSSQMLHHATDSKIIVLANEFPTNISQRTKIAVNNFVDKYKTICPNIKLHVTKEYNIFYPKWDFDFAITQILNNIIKHAKDNNPSMCDTDIFINKITESDSENEFIELIIKNINSVDGAKKKNGALSQIKSDVELFKGKLDIIKNENFEVILKFLYYGADN